MIRCLKTAWFGPTVGWLNAIQPQHIRFPGGQMAEVLPLFPPFLVLCFWSIKLYWFTLRRWFFSHHSRWFIGVRHHSTRRAIIFALFSLLGIGFFSPFFTLIFVFSFVFSYIELAKQEGNFTQCVFIFTMLIFQSTSTQ